jgi:hypothetical protein
LWKENKESEKIFDNKSFVEMECSKLINYSTNMCWSGGKLLLKAPRNSSNSKILKKKLDYGGGV